MLEVIHDVGETGEKVMSTISIGQQKQFWVMFSSACRNRGISGSADQEAYRKEILKVEGGVAHLKDLDRTSGYDKVMARLSADAGKYEEACKYLASTAQRFIAVIRSKATALVGETKWVEYVKGIVEHAGFGTRSLEDMTDRELRAIIAILDTHRRRRMRSIKRCRV